LSLTKKLPPQLFVLPTVFFYLEWSQRQVSQVESIAHEQNAQRISNLLQEKALVIS
jgi:hypothetical protein